MAWRQAITPTNADLVHRCICAALGGDELTPSNEKGGVSIVVDF